MTKAMRKAALKMQPRYIKDLYYLGAVYVDPIDTPTEHAATVEVGPRWYHPITWMLFLILALYACWQFGLKNLFKEITLTERYDIVY